MTDTADNYLRDLGFLLRERAFEAKASFHAADKESRGFESGRYMAYYEVLALMLSQAQAFDLPLSMLALDGVDAERDLIG